VPIKEPRSGEPPCRIGDIIVVGSPETKKEDFNYPLSHPSLLSLYQASKKPPTGGWGFFGAL